MNVKILEDLGVKKSEIKVYLTLLELGSCRAGKILKRLKIQNSVLHYSLNGLIQKGLVSYVKKGKVRVYKAADPDTLIEYVDGKRDELQKILPELKKRQYWVEEKEEVEFFEGKRGVKTALYSIIEDAKPRDRFLFFSADVKNYNKEIQEFYKKFDAKRKAKRLIVKGIAPKRLKSLYVKRKYLKMKYVTFPIPENMGICNNKMAIITWGEVPKAILITSRTVVEKEREFFEEIWERSTS